MQVFVASLLLLANLLQFSRNAEIGRAVLLSTPPTAAEDEHLEIFRDGFLLDDEETMNRRVKIPKDNKISDENNVSEDFIPMIDPEADSDMIEKFGDFSLPKVQIKQMKPRKHRRSKRLVVDLIQKWEKGIIPYFIYEEHYTPLQINLILRGMAHWENHTCIRFKKRTNERTYLVIYPGSSCFSLIGKSNIQGPQGLSLAPVCFLTPRTVIHELGHVIGLFHEHTRPDRNEYIRVNYHNIKQGADASQFDVLRGDFSTRTQGLPYDYNSIMHYGGYQVAKDSSSPTIEALDPNITVGKAVTLSHFDVIRVNIYYQCQEPFPAKTTHWVPLDPPEVKIPPRPHNCGALIMGQYNGSVSSPGYPQFTPDIDCSWQIIVPEGYRININIKSFGLKTSYSNTCQNSSITFLQLDYTKRYSSRICNYDLYHDRPYYTRNNEAHIEYRSGPQSSDAPNQSFSMNFTSVDINECEENAKCSHKCTNTPGSYICTCNPGYFLSADGHTCFDINECAIDGSLCEYKCRNVGGHYKCICPNGSYQTGPSCAHTEQASADVTTIPIAESPVPSTHPPSPPSTKPPTTSAPTEPPTTTPISTDAPTTVMPTPVMVETQLTKLQGDFSSPNWPDRYPQNVDYEWHINCPSDHSVEINFGKTPFGIAGQMPDCNTDWIQILKGGSEDVVLGRFCGSTMPSSVKTDYNTAVMKFHAGANPSSSNSGFGASYKCVYKCPPIEMPSLPSCGGYIKANSGTITSPNFPTTYNINEKCEWIIELPDCQKAMEITFTHFSVAGKMPECPKDQLYIDDGSVSESQTHGPLCHLSLPPAITTTSNVARIRFVAGPKHGSRRTGFSLTFNAINKSS